MSDNSEDIPSDPVDRLKRWRDTYLTVAVVSLGLSGGSLYYLPTVTQDEVEGYIRQLDRIESINEQLTIENKLQGQRIQQLESIVTEHVRRRNHPPEWVRREIDHINEEISALKP